METQEQSSILNLLDETKKDWFFPINVRHIDENRLETIGDISVYIYTETSYWSRKEAKKIYFGLCTTEKPFSKDCPEWRDLFSRLSNSCRGTKLVMNGDWSTKKSDEEKHLKQICCFRCRPVSLNTTVITSQDQLSGYRPSSAHNDYANNRKDGNIGGKRKATTARATSNYEHCPFKMAIGYNEIGGYYLAVGKGCCHHRGHIPDHTLDFRISSKHVTHDMIQNLQHLRSVNAGEQIGGKFFYRKTGLILSRTQIQFISRFKGNTVNIIEGRSHNPRQIIEYFRTQNIQYVALLNGKKHLIDVRVSTFHESFDPEKGTFELSDCNKFQSPDMDSFFAAERKNLDEDKNLFTAVAWTSKSEKNHYIKYPYVIGVDTSAQTNHEDRPLFTVVVRSVDSKWFPIMRALFPSECQWVFGWIFNCVFDILLGKQWRTQTLLAITDGDSNEINQLRLSINTGLQDDSLVRTHHRRCSAHFILKALDNYGPSIQRAIGKRKSGENYVAYKAILRNVKNWCFSFAQPGYCETADECELSQSLLLDYISSSTVQSVLGEDEGKVLLQCVRGYILPHILSFAYYRYSHLRHFGIHSNNGVEGTHYAYKHSASRLSTRDSLANMASTLHDNNELRLKSQTSRANLSQSWSVSKTSSFVITTAEYELMQAKLRQQLYMCCRSSMLCWEVAYTYPAESQQLKTIIPSFRRKRLVQMSLDGYLTCSCNYFQTFGLGCPHMLRVISRTISTADNFCYEYAHTDVSVVWWNAYVNCQVDDNCTMWQSFKALREKDIIGPRMPAFAELLKTNPETTRYQSLQNIVFGCRNYCRNNLPHSQYAGFTQETNVPMNLDYNFSDSSNDNAYSSNENEIQFEDPTVIVKDHNDIASDIAAKSSINRIEEARAYSLLYGHFQHFCSNVDTLPVEEREKEIVTLKNFFDTKSAEVKNKKQQMVSSKKSNVPTTVSTNVVQIKKQSLISKKCF